MSLLLYRPKWEFEVSNSLTMLKDKSRWQRSGERLLTIAKGTDFRSVAGTENLKDCSASLGIRM